MGYVVNILEWGFHTNYGLFCGTYRYIDNAKIIPVTNLNSSQKPKIYKTKTGADKAVERLCKRYNMVCQVEECDEKTVFSYPTLFERINNPNQFHE